MNDREICQAFANKHKVIFEDAGEAGFGRPCVGFNHGNNWVDHNPLNMSGEYKEIEAFADPRLYAPKDVKNAYHKHNCLVVLKNPQPEDTDDGTERAISELARWVEHLEALGEVEIVRYNTGAKGFQALLTGVMGMAVRIKAAEPVERTWVERQDVIATKIINVIPHISGGVIKELAHAFAIAGDAYEEFEALVEEERLIVENEPKAEEEEPSTSSKK